MRETLLVDHAPTASDRLQAAAIVVGGLLVIATPFFVTGPLAPKVWASIEGPSLLCVLVPWVAFWTFASLLGLMRFVNRRFGRCELRPEVCVLESPAHGHRVELPWSEVESFDDGWASSVVLHPKASWSAPHPLALLPLTIPTPDEAARVQVLERLAAAGLQRR